MYLFTYRIIYIYINCIYYRLIRYNAATKKNEILMRNLGFANGVRLSDDESFVIVVESQTSRIMKYNLKGPKVGQSEVFIDGLPGTPDNIHSDGQGGFLVCLIMTIDSENPQIFHSLMPHPYLRKMLVRLLVTMELPFKLLHDIYPNTYTERILHAIGSFQSAKLLMDSVQKSQVLRIDASGNIIEVLSSDDGSVYRISSAYIHNDFVWFGTPWLDYLTRIPLKQVFPDLADSAKQSSHVKKQSPNAASDTKTERVKRNADSTTAKPIKSETPQTTSKPTAAPVTPKPTVTPKPSPAPKADKTTDSGNVKPSETKSSTNTEAKKDSAKTVDDAKRNTQKSNSPKSEENRKKDNAAKAQSGKNVKVEPDASVKQTAQKSQPEKAKRVEANRPRDDL